VSAPTSSGKTVVGVLAALRGTIDRKRSFLLLPLMTLVNDKYQQFNRTYGSFGLRTIRAAGDTIDDFPALMRGQYGICLLTYEKFSARVLGGPYYLDQVSTVVVDYAVRWLAYRRRRLLNSTGAGFPMRASNGLAASWTASMSESSNGM
jgi:helicase